MKKYHTPHIILKSFECESILTASGKTESEKVVTEMLEQNGATAVKSVSWDDMF